MKQAIKKEIRKHIKRINGCHVGTVKQMLRIQFPSINPDDWSDFIEQEFSKKYSKI